MYGVWRFDRALRHFANHPMATALKGRARLIPFVQAHGLRARPQPSVGQSPLPKIVHPRSKPCVGGSSVRDDGRLALGSGDCPAASRFGADQKPKRSCSLRASKNRSRHRVTAFGVWRVWRLTFGVWAFVHMSPSSANSSTSSSAFSNIKKPSTLYSFLFLEPFDFQDRRYQKTGGPGRTHPRAAATDFCEMPRAGTMLFLNTGGL